MALWDEFLPCRASIPAAINNALQRGSVRRIIVSLTPETNGIVARTSTLSSMIRGFGAATWPMGGIDREMKRRDFIGLAAIALIEPDGLLVSHHFNSQRRLVKLDRA